MKKLNDDIAFWHWARARQAKSGVSWSSYWATQFATAAGITDAGQIAIVKDLCADFVAAGLWDKMKAIYPFIGGTADAHKINLKDPRDADDAFRITWSGTVAHSALGIKGNGTNGYGNTHLTIAANLTWSNFHFSAYSRDGSNAATGYEIGTMKGTDYNVIAANLTGVGGTFLAGHAFAGLALTTFNNTDGLFTVTKTASNVAYRMRNGHVFNAVTSATVDGSNDLPFLICCTNRNTGIQGYNDRQISFICIGDGLTPYEEQLKYAIIRKYINAMDAHSAYDNQILFESWQPATLDQVSLTFKVNTGHKIYVDWGEDDPVEITGDGSEVTVTSDYGTHTKTYYGRIYGEITELIKFEVATEATFSGLNVNDFRRLNVPLYELSLTTIKMAILDVSLLPRGLTILLLVSVGSYTGYGSANGLPVYLQQFTTSGTNGLTMDNLTALPSSLTYLSVAGKANVNIDNLPSGLENLLIYSCTTPSGSLANLPATLKRIDIVTSGTGINITTAPFKPWATTNITITSAYTTAAVDGFFNTYAAVAADGAATLNLAGVGAGTANQADSAASAAAQATLVGLSKTIQTN